MGQASQGCTRTHVLSRLATPLKRVAAAIHRLLGHGRLTTPATTHVEAKALLSSAPPLAAKVKDRLSGMRAAIVVGVIVMAPTCMVLQSTSGHAQTLPSEMSGNPNEVLVFEQMRVPRWLAETVVRAAQVTSVDPAYLMALADKESSLLPENKARTSSAEGLFQFIEGTWLEVLRRYGPKHGYAAEAEAIQIVQGRPVVSDSNERERILSLRGDPYLSALMAGEMITTHRQILAGKVARDPSFAELYMAHFLGVNGASRFVALLSDTPEKRASEAFPRAAKANSALFFDKKEAARAKAKALSVAEVQGRVGAMIDKRVARYASVRTNLAPAQKTSE